MTRKPPTPPRRTRRAPTKKSTDPHQRELLRQARNAGESKMIQAYLNANRNSPDWGERAHWALATFAARHRDSFTAEVARLAMEEKRLVDKPHDGRAYGAVFKRAIKLGVIRRVGFAPTIASHGSPMAVYEANRPGGGLQ